MYMELMLNQNLTLINKIKMDVQIIKYFLLFSAMVLIISHNCNGLKNVQNFKQYVSFITERRYNICLLQETFWTDDYVDSIRHLYNGKIFCSNGDRSRQGVAILVNNNMKDNVKLIFKDDIGRFLHVEYEVDDKIFNIINIYAPNDIQERQIFFDFIENYIKTLDNIFIGGDFNNSLSPLDRCNKTGHVEDTAYKALVKIIDNNNMYDIWRARNKSVRHFSFKRVSNGKLQQSRIDYFLCSRNLSNNVQYVYYNYTSMSDHSFVVLHFNATVVERGPGLWILNNTLLSDDIYVENIRKIIEEQKLCPLYNTDVLIWWDNLKFKIKQYSKLYSMKKAKEKKQEFYYIQNRFKKISQDYADGKKLDLTEYENLRIELKEYESNICNGAILRAKANWAVDSDCNSKYFLNLEKFKQENNCIKELICDSNEIVSDTDSILEEQYAFYRKLYSCVDIDVNKMNTLLDYNEQKVDDDDIEICDADICEAEIRKALWEMAANKSPGSDGLTVEFYKHFYTFLQDILYKLFIDVQENETLSRSMKCGVINLIYKKKGDKRLLKNYRPISLLQVDYKIIARVMANRFKRVLPKLVSENQSCCVLGKDIADTICNIRDIIDMVECDNLEGYILKIDQEKAFDRVSHEYLIETLKHFGFGNKFVNWIKIFYSGICSSVKCNGFLTNYFSIKNGIRQGCPISALLYVLTAESLQSALRKNDKIQGITVPNSDKVGLAFQHADDTTVTLRNRESINETFKVFELYSAGSGAKINIEKSEIMTIGSGCLSQNEIDEYKIKVCNDCIQILGVYVGKDFERCLIMNWKEKVKKIKCILNMWLQRNLTIQGRATVISSLLMSRLWYTLSVFPIPEWVVKEIKTCCIKFLWKNGSHLLNYQTIIGDKLEGGLKFEDIYLKMLSFRLKFLSRLVDTNYNVLWKEICKHFLKKVGNMNLEIELLSLELNDKMLHCLPQFYKEMLQAWQHIREKTDIEYCTDMLYKQSLFLNPVVKIDNKSLYWKHFIDSGIVSLKDIAYEVRTGFLPVQAIIDIISNVYDEFDVNVVKKQYLQMISALPETWHNTVNTEINIKCDQQCSEYKIDIKHRIINLSSCITKTFYQLLRNKCFIPPNCVTFWEEHFNTSIIFTPIWRIINTKWKPPDLVELDFKIVHNRIYTNEKLYKIGLSDSPECTVCNQDNEDLCHLFIHCTMLQTFHKYIENIVETLFENCDSDKMTVVKYEKLMFLGQSEPIKGVNVYFLNFIFSLVRFCIFKRRNISNLKNENLDIVRFFKHTLRHYVSYFHVYCCKMNNKRTLFEKHFLNDNELVSETDDILVFII